MLHHFTKIHNPSDMIIKAIEICSILTIKDRERFWINELNTAFPYGLNDRINSPPIKDAYSFTKENRSINIPIYNTFNKIPSRRSKRGGRHRNNSAVLVDSSFNADLFMDNINSPQLDNHQFYINFVRDQIMSLNKSNTKMLFLHLCRCINDHSPLYHKYIANEFSAYLPYLVKDIAFFKLRSMLLKHQFLQKQKSQHFIIVNFCNPMMDSINFKNIINHRNIITLFPLVEDLGFKTPIVSFKYSPTIRSKIV